jgi:hypothetical protein
MKQAACFALSDTADTVEQALFGEEGCSFQSSCVDTDSLVLHGDSQTLEHVCTRMSISILVPWQTSNQKRMCTQNKGWIVDAAAHSSQQK